MAGPSLRRVRWSEEALSPGALLERHRLPCLVHVRTGFHGQNELDVVSAGQMALVDSLFSQRRAYACDIRGRMFSFPESFRIPFEVHASGRKKPRLRSLRQILAESRLPVTVTLDGAAEGGFRAGERLYTRASLGTLILLRDYVEHFLRVNAVSPAGALEQRATLLPLYVDVELEVGEGCIGEGSLPQGGASQEWSQFMLQLQRTLDSRSAEPASGSDVVLVYDRDDSSSYPIIDAKTGLISRTGSSYQSGKPYVLSPASTSINVNKGPLAAFHMDNEIQHKAVVKNLNSSERVIRKKHSDGNNNIEVISVVNAASIIRPNVMVGNIDQGRNNGAILIQPNLGTGSSVIGTNAIPASRVNKRPRTSNNSAEANYASISRTNKGMNIDGHGSISKSSHLSLGSDGKGSVASRKSDKSKASNSLDNTSSGIGGSISLGSRIESIGGKNDGYHLSNGSSNVRENPQSNANNQNSVNLSINERFEESSKDSGTASNSGKQSIGYISKTSDSSGFVSSHSSTNENTSNSYYSSDNNSSNGRSADLRSTLDNSLFTSEAVGINGYHQTDDVFSSLTRHNRSHLTPIPDETEEDFSNDNDSTSPQSNTFMTSAQQEGRRGIALTNGHSRVGRLEEQVESTWVTSRQNGSSWQTAGEQGIAAAETGQYGVIKGELHQPRNNMDFIDGQATCISSSLWQRDGVKLPSERGGARQAWTQDGDIGSPTTNQQHPIPAARNSLINREIRVIGDLSPRQSNGGASFHVNNGFENSVNIQNGNAYNENNNDNVFLDSAPVTVISYTKATPHQFLSHGPAASSPSPRTRSILRPQKYSSLNEESLRRLRAEMTADLENSYFFTDEALRLDFGVPNEVEGTSGHGHFDSVERPRFQPQPRKKSAIRRGASRHRSTVKRHVSYSDTDTVYPVDTSEDDQGAYYTADSGLDSDNQAGSGYPHPRTRRQRLYGQYVRSSAALGGDARARGIAGGGGGSNEELYAPQRHSDRRRGPTKQYRHGYDLSSSLYAPNRNSQQLQPLQQQQQQHQQQHQQQQQQARPPSSGYPPRSRRGDHPEVQWSSAVESLPHRDVSAYADHARSDAYGRTSRQGQSESVTLNPISSRPASRIDQPINNDLGRYPAPSTKVIRMMPTSDGRMDVEISDRREPTTTNLDDRFRKLHIRTHSDSHPLPLSRQTPTSPYSPPVAGSKPKQPKVRNTHSIDGARGPKSTRGFESWQSGGGGSLRGPSAVIRMDPMGAMADESLGRASRQSVKKSRV